MEILRLEDENRALREMLAIAEDAANGINGTSAMGEEDEVDKVEDEVFSGSRIRKASLTVEELEAGAEQEAAEKEARAREPPGTGLGGGGGVQEGTIKGGKERPVVYEGMLGFRPEMAPPEEAIDDGPDG